MTRWLAILAFIALAGVASAQYSDVRIHASQPTKQGPEVWFAEGLPESLYNNASFWLPCPKAYTSTQYSFAVSYFTNHFLISGATYSNQNGGSMYFNGTSAYLIGTTVSDGVYTGRPLSVMAWVKPTNANLDGAIIGKSIPPGTAWDGHILVNVAGSPGVLYFVVGNGSQQGFATVSGCLTNGWQHLAACWDSTGNIQIYKNGIKQATADTGLPYTGTISNTAALFVGRQTGTGRRFTGLIDDVASFRSAISSNDVFSYYQQTRGKYGL